MATLNLNVTVPDAQATGILHDFCAYHGYSDQIETEPGVFIDNPQTRAQFAKATIARFVKESIRAYRATESAEAARQAEISAVDAIAIS